MSQRDVNAEGLEKSFAVNVLGESQHKHEVWRRWPLGEDGNDSETLCRYLHPHQEPCSFAGEESRSQSGESVLYTVSYPVYTLRKTEEVHEKGSNGFFSD